MSDALKDRNHEAFAKAIAEVPEWTIQVNGTSEYEKGCRAGIETVFVSIEQYDSKFRITQHDEAGNPLLDKDGNPIFEITFGLIEDVYLHADLQSLFQDVQDWFGADERHQLAVLLRRIANEIDP